jgi:hypothetical protein
VAKVRDLFGLAIATHFLTKTSQAGLLLYTSVVRFTPTDLKHAPGFDPYIAPIRADLQQRWSERPSFPKVRDRRLVSAAVKSYLKDTAADGQAKSHGNSNAFCLKLATETCRRNLFALPGLVIDKFRYAAPYSPAGRLDHHWLSEKQRHAYEGSLPLVKRLAPRLFGRGIQTEAQIHEFIGTHYQPVPWVDQLSDRWLAVVKHFRLPDRVYPGTNPRKPFVYLGVPYYFLLAAAGLVAVAFRRGALQPFHLAWGLTLLGFFFVIMLTGNVRPRFRLVFEPFWFLYIGLLLELLWLLSTRLFRRT